MKTTLLMILGSIMVIWGCTPQNDQITYPENNPLFTEFNQPVDFTAVTSAHLDEATEFTISYCDEKIKSIIAERDPNFENMIVAMDDMSNEMFKVMLSGSLIANTHADSLMRATALNQTVSLRKFANGIFQNKELYESFDKYAQTEEGQALEGYKKKALNDLLYSFESNGMGLADADREKLKTIKEEILDLTTQFRQNINTYSDYLVINEEQSAGLPSSYKNQRKGEDGSYSIDMSYPSITPFFKFSPSEKLRKDLMTKYSNRAADKNLEVLDKLIAKRHEMAVLLGYSSFAEQNLKDRMAKHPDNVWEFERELVEKVRNKAKEDYAELLAFKRKDKESQKITDKINRWDISYYTNKLKKEKYDFDSEEIKNYFSMETSLEGLFHITQSLFGLEYKEVESAQVWHEDVKMYEVYQDNALIGRFYLDLYPRPNKYTHMACFPMRPGKNTQQGYQLPMASLVCNFPQPTEEKPSLLSHGQVETLFHEFGHVLHNILYNAELAGQSILSVKRDFVEAPSQIFENWTWEYDALKLFARHYETGEVLPKALFDKMEASKNVNSGINAQTQIFLGVYDFTLHDKYTPDAEFDTDKIARAVSDTIMQVSRVLDGTHFQAGFGHLTGYGASYYGYLWSLVYAQDMYSIFEENGPLHRESGKKYADVILANGSSREEIDLVKEFLGREPNNEAFIRSLGL